MAKLSRFVFSLALLAATALVVLSSDAGLLSGEGGGGIPGGITDVPNVGANKEVQALGRFSVDQYNNQAKGGAPSLIFSKVVSAKQQVVSGMKYFLKIAATQGSAPLTYDAVVVVQPWKHPGKLLLDFKPSKS